FLRALAGVRPSNRFKIVVVDKRSLRVLNDVLKLSEVLENDVIRIESIENGRKEDPSTEALYILTPSKQSVGRLISDFVPSQSASPQGSSRGFGLSSSGAASKQPTYRAAHVFFTSELPDTLFAMLKAPAVAHHLKALKELCVEYDVHDAHVFLAKLADRPLYRLYSPLLASNCNEELDLISKKLVNVCGALKDDPVVRFFSPDPEIYGNTKARRLAFLFHTEMERVRQALPPQTPGGGGGGSSSSRVPTELIIVDRSADPLAPILHEFTYEAMVHDLLDIEDGNKFHYTIKLASGAEEVKTVVLGDADPIWQEYRFQHISDAQESIMRKFEGLIGSNRAIVDMQAGERLDLSRMRDVVSSMPHFKDQLSHMSAHITMMQQCMERFNERCLNDLGMIEQNLAVGTTPDGEKYRSGDIDIAHVLNNPAIEPEDKLRLLLVYFVSNPSLTEPERLKLAQLAKLDRSSRVTIQNMGIWALVSSMRTPSSGSQGQAEDEPRPFDLSRYVPVAKHVLEACIEGHLSEDIFPYVMPPEKPREAPAYGSTGALRGSAPGASQSDRAGFASTGSTAASSSSPTAPQHDSPAASGAGAPQQRGRQQPRIILFVIGGVAYSEVRAADEIARKYGREVIVGSTNLTTPRDFLQ
ncbi:Sec1-like protein, partial [Martensiomyces pterosporus]